jgi:hypothetical protein
METALRMLRLWGAVLPANLVGHFFALCVARIPVFSPPIEQALTSVSRDGRGAGFWVVVARAIFGVSLVAFLGHAQVVAGKES